MGGYWMRLLMALSCLCLTSAENKTISRCLLQTRSVDLLAICNQNEMIWVKELFLGKAVDRTNDFCDHPGFHETHCVKRSSVKSIEAAQSCSQYRTCRTTLRWNPLDFCGDTFTGEPYASLVFQCLSRLTSQGASIDYIRMTENINRTVLESNFLLTREYTDWSSRDYNQCKVKVMPEVNITIHVLDLRGRVIDGLDECPYELYITDGTPRLHYSVCARSYWSDEVIQVPVSRTPFYVDIVFNKAVSQDDAERQGKLWSLIHAAYRNGSGADYEITCGRDLELIPRPTTTTTTLPTSTTIKTTTPTITTAQTTTQVATTSPTTTSAASSTTSSPTTTTTTTSTASSTTSSPKTTTTTTSTASTTTSPPTTTSTTSLNTVTSSSLPEMPTTSSSQDVTPTSDVSHSIDTTETTRSAAAPPVPTERESSTLSHQAMASLIGALVISLALVVVVVVLVVICRRKRRNDLNRKRLVSEQPGKSGGNETMQRNQYEIDNSTFSNIYDEIGHKARPKVEFGHHNVTASPAMRLDDEQFDRRSSDGSTLPTMLNFSAHFDQDLNEVNRTAIPNGDANTYQHNQRKKKSKSGKRKELTRKVAKPDGFDEPDENARRIYGATMEAKFRYDNASSETLPSY